MSLTEMEGFAAIEILCSHINNQASSKQFTVLITVPAYWLMVLLSLY